MQKQNKQIINEIVLKIKEFANVFDKNQLAILFKKLSNKKSSLKKQLLSDANKQIIKMSDKRKNSSHLTSQKQLFSVKEDCNYSKNQKISNNSNNNLGVNITESNTHNSANNLSHDNIKNLDKGKNQYASNSNLLYNSTSGAISRHKNSVNSNNNCSNPKQIFHCINNSKFSVNSSNSAQLNATISNKEINTSNVSYVFLIY